MLFIVLFISFIVFFSSRIFVWFFLMIDILLLKLSLFVCIVFLTSLRKWNHCLAVFSCTTAHWAILKQLFWILYGVNHRSLYLQGKLLDNYCDPFVVLCFLNFSRSLKFCIVVFTFEVAPLPVFTDNSGENYLLSAEYLLSILKFSQAFSEYTCSTLLAPPCGRILKIAYLL